LNLKRSQRSYAEKNAVNLLNVDVIAELLPDCTLEGEVAMGWSLAVISERRVRRFRRRMNVTLNATAMTSAPMTPPAMAGALDFREGVDGVGETECEDAEGVCDAEYDDGVDVGVLINSGL